MEYLDIIDENGNPVGFQVSRELAHGRGILHRTGHVWIFSRKPDGIYVWLQKRSETKSSFPGLYDISTAGHIPAGAEPLESACREAREELGISIHPSDLIRVGKRYMEYREVFFGKPFFDRQISDVYALEDPGFSYTFEDGEVSAMKEMPVLDALEQILDGSLESCIVWQELLCAYLSFVSGSSILKPGVRVNDFMRFLEQKTPEQVLKMVRRDGLNGLKALKESDTILMFSSDEQKE